jgi:hypothetical protein
MTRWLTPERINELASNPAHCSRMDLPLAVDSQRPYIPEDYTQLYYTPIYHTLNHAQRVRYNQLFALRVNEYIMMLEADLIERLLPPLRRHPRVVGEPALLQAMDTMIAEERRHFQGFAALNRTCRPDLYPPGTDRYFSLLPWWTQAMFGTVGLLSAHLAFALWFLMAMEESAKSLAKDMVARPVTEALGPLDPAFVSVHREHLKDETRHLHIDAILIAKCLDRRGERANAWLFKRMLLGVVRPTRGGSGVKVIRQLIQDMPELAPRQDEMIDALMALRHDLSFQASLFNRRIMPATFRIFDQCKALAGLSEEMVGYDRQETA